MASLAKSIKLCYTYDVLNRVTKRTKKSLTDNTILSEETFAYDAAGNVTSANGETAQYSLNNRIMVFNGSSVGCDLDGNLNSINFDSGWMDLTYDSKNRLTSAGGHTYTYDAEDVRIRNLCGDVDTTYAYDTNGKLSRLLMKTTNSVTTKYVYGIGLIGEQTGNDFLYYHFDSRGSTVAITGGTGIVTDTFEYDTYGKVISHTGNNNVIFGYNGRDGVVTDANGLLYMRARYYSPEMRRFVNADVIAGEISDAITLNRYAYANGNPVSFVDPFGLSSVRTRKNLPVITRTTSTLAEDPNAAEDIEQLPSVIGRIIRNPWWELSSWNQIHNKVVEHIHEVYGFYKEHVPYKGSKNRYDLYCPSQKTIWEVKPISYKYDPWRQGKMMDQLTKYMKDGVSLGEPLNLTNYKIPYRKYTIYVESIEPGKIYYRFEREEKEKETQPVTVPAKNSEKEKETEKEVSPKQSSWGSRVKAGGEMIAAGILIVWLAGNNFSGIGALDDVAIPAALYRFYSATSMAFAG